MNTQTALAIVVVLIVVVVFISSNRGDTKRAKSLGDFTLGPATSVVIRLPDTGRTGVDSVLTFRCTITSDNFFGQNDGDPAEGHFGFMLRADLAAIDTGAYRGHGVILGSLWTGSAPPNGMRSMTSCAAIETWAKGAADEPAQWVKPQSVSTPLRDGVSYPLEIVSAPSGGKWLISYRIGDFQSPPIEDDNTHIDPASQAIALFAVNSGGGVVHVSGATAQWS
jgi:hypothetical protein